MQGDTNPERTSRVYFGIFLLLAVFGGWAIWQGLEWRELTNQKYVFPVATKTAKDESIIYGRRGTVESIADNSLVMRANTVEAKQSFTVRKRSTQVWYILLGDDIKFNSATWKNIEAGQNIYAISKSDIGDKKIFDASKIYIIMGNALDTNGLPDILGDEIKF